MDNDAIKYFKGSVPGSRKQQAAGAVYLAFHKKTKRHMYPFVTLGLLWIAAPLAAYSIQNQKITLLKALLIWSACLTTWYLGMAGLGYQAIGEEGNYNAWTVVWWLLNFFIFQAFRLPKSRARNILIAPGLVLVSMVCLWMAVIVFANLFFGEEFR